MSQNAILVINAGSSSIKFSLFAINEGEEQALELIYRGNMSGLGTHAHFVAKNAIGLKLLEEDLGTATHEAAFTRLLSWMEERDDGLTLYAVGHRVVHGGVTFTKPVEVTPEIFQQLEALGSLAPLHQPHNLAPIQVLDKLKGHLPQVACFDTAFHTTQTLTAQRFGIPREYTEQGIKRYGFHGLSYEYIAQKMPSVVGKLPEKVVVAHLGNGSSMCAIRNGKSVASTMGFTALDGLPMGTRTGAIDAGVILHFLNQGMDVKELTKLLYNRSGLLGVSGISNDMETLLASDSPHAKEAIDYFIYRIGCELGSMTSTINGIDALVFTAGIGEYASLIRAGVCEKAEWLGIKLNPEANAKHASCISTPDSRVSVWVIPTNEEKMIAQHTLRILKG
ncbi:acetate/propionate family kinase [Beggiatoa leptomitoformis]|uniref:Acetate kinase n=1 Tax=Beggiatoa leptomitoformis TaxID=288004 RepID=A0A2N9YFE3_9GAMM|nr:acetate/propionate family kinase [Beggiatoa leptomitoformis]ALG68449.1 acetate/propionate family kinase [Beggiatoa leptomitoformis]AUI69218.1 acetate/propionate family kinase [Beggiatoa leptomitoformis]